MTQPLNPPVEEVTMAAVEPNFLDWCTWAVADWAESVERLNNDIEADRTNNVIWRDVVDILSLRRWAFVLPGGGAVRGGRRTRIRPATPTATPRPVRSSRSARPAAVSVQTANSGGVVFESQSFRDK